MKFTNTNNFQRNLINREAALNYLISEAESRLIKYMRQNDIECDSELIDTGSDENHESQQIECSWASIKVSDSVHYHCNVNSDGDISIEILDDDAKYEDYSTDLFQKTVKSIAIRFNKISNNG